MDAGAGPQERVASTRISSSSRSAGSSTLFFSSRDLAGAQPGYTDDDLESLFDLQVDAILSNGMTPHEADDASTAFQFQFQLPAAHSAPTPQSPSVADELFRCGRIVPLGELLLLADKEEEPGEGKDKASAGIGNEGKEPRMTPLDTAQLNRSEDNVRRPVGPVEGSDVGRAGAPRGANSVDGNAGSGRRRRSTGAPEATTETPTTQQPSRVWMSNKPPKPRRGGGSSVSFLKLLIKLPSDSIRSAYLFFVRPEPNAESLAGATSPSRPQKPKKPVTLQGMLVPIYRFLAPNGRKAHKERQRVVFELGGGSPNDVLEAMRLSNASSSGRWRDSRSPAGGASRPTSRPGSPLSSPQHRGAWGAADREREAARERRRVIERDSSISSAIAYCKGV